MTLPPSKSRWNWRSRAARGLLWQVVVLCALALTPWFLAHNTAVNMEARGIQSGFDFLVQPAGFDIGETVFEFDSERPYWRAFLAGVFNTLRVAITGILLTTLLGTLLGIGRTSHNLLVRTVCTVYVEIFRNIPVLLQLLMWYLVLAVALPPFDAPYNWGVFQLDKNGLAWMVGTEGDTLFTFSPEFLAVLLGLTLYTASFVAEVVRAGITSVPQGQGEAAASLGLSRGQTMRYVMLPQALRVIIPPMTNQYLNLTKNSSLAVAIGYPDVVSIANTALNQTGRAVECIAVIMTVYLITSLATSLFMNWYNARAALKER
ncbi:MAG: ABC transporter permease subunit [Hylemonella sp.]|nr:ABC transporter permease subunit [Hylemonella sp.]